jgi:hypothetical protein
MRDIRSAVTIVGLFALTACFKEDEVIYRYDVSPFAELKDIRFEEGGSNQRDTLFVSIFLADEEMDIGLNADDRYHPFEQFNLVVDSELDTVLWDNSEYTPPYFLVLPFKDHIDTMYFSRNDPRLEGDSCQRNALYTDKGLSYVTRNPNNLNFLVDLFVEREGSFVPIQDLFVTPGCGVGFGGRLPRPYGYKGTYTTGPYKITRFNKFEILVEYAMVSDAYQFLINSAFKIKITVADRGLNFTQPIETDEFFLLDKKK